VLKRISVNGFKSLVDVELELPRLVVPAGPNAAGKSNVLAAALRDLRLRL
jgi:predicted ATPase